MKTRKRYSVAAVCVRQHVQFPWVHLLQCRFWQLQRAVTLFRSTNLKTEAPAAENIYNEGWKGNTEEDGSGEDFDLTNASGGFSYLDQKGTTVSLKVTVEEAGLYEMKISYCEPHDKNKRCNT